MLDEFRAEGQRLARRRAAAGAAAGARALQRSATCPRRWRNGARRRQPHPGGGARRARQRAGEPTIFVTKDINLRIRADALGLTAEDFDSESGRDRRALLRHARSWRWPRRRRRRVLRSRATLPHAGGAAFAPTSTCCSRTATTRRTRAMGKFDAAAASSRAAAASQQGRRLGHPAAQQGAALRARSAAQRRHQAGHAGRQGRHRQDAARASPPACRRRSRSGVYPQAARVAAHLPARARHRLPAGRHRGEAQPVDAADLRQRRVPDGPLARPTKKAGRSYHGADRPRHPRDRAADLHPRPLASPTSTSSSTRRRTSRRTR